MKRFGINPLHHLSAQSVRLPEDHRVVFYSVENHTRVLISLKLSIEMACIYLIQDSKYSIETVKLSMQQEKFRLLSVIQTRFCYIILETMAYHKSNLMFMEIPRDICNRGYKFSGWLKTGTIKHLIIPIIREFEAAYCREILHLHFLSLFVIGRKQFLLCMQKRIFWSAFSTCLVRCCVQFETQNLNLLENSTFQ